MKRRYLVDIPLDRRIKMLIARTWALTLLPLEALCLFLEPGLFALLSRCSSAIAFERLLRTWTEER